MSSRSAAWLVCKASNEGKKAARPTAEEENLSGAGDGVGSSPKCLKTAIALGMCTLLVTKTKPRMPFPSRIGLRSTACS
jgi:hypothetical protein